VLHQKTRKRSSQMRALHALIRLMRNGLMLPARVYPVFEYRSYQDLVFSNLPRRAHASHACIAHGRTRPAGRDVDDDGRSPRTSEPRTQAE
jgi:hypothetical protein